MDSKLDRLVNNWTGIRQAMSLVLTTVLLMGFNTASFAGVLALSSSLDLVTQSGRSTFEVIDTANASQGSTTNTLGAISANAVSVSAGGTSVTSASATATWSNSAQGQVRFEHLGWDNTAFSSGVVSESSLAGTQWAYTFVADVTGQFYLDWTTSLEQAVADSFGLIDFRFSLAGAGGGQTVMASSSGGSTTRNIIAGNTYTALIHTDAGIVGGIGGRNSFMNGVFDWSMDSGPPAAAPEPSVLLLLGMGLMGLGIRRKRLAA